MKTGDVVTIEITGVKPYGAFARTTQEPVRIGLVHISQIREAYIPDITEYLQVGDLVQAEILNVNPITEKLAFSVKSFPLPRDRKRNDESLYKQIQDWIKVQESETKIQKKYQDFLNHYGGEAIEKAFILVTQKIGKNMVDFLFEQMLIALEDGL